MTASGELLSEITETRNTLEDVARRKRRKSEEEEQQTEALRAARRMFSDEEAHKTSEKIALGREILELVDKLRNDKVFLEAFRLCMELDNKSFSARHSDRVTIYERNLTNPSEASPENSWLVGHRDVLDTFRLDSSLNLIFRQTVPPEHMAEAMLEIAYPYRGERHITGETDFAPLNSETVKGFHKALLSGSVEGTLADMLKTYRSRLADDLNSNL